MGATSGASCHSTTTGGLCIHWEPGSWLKVKAASDETILQSSSRICSRITIFTCYHCFHFTCSYYLWMTSSPVKLSPSPHIWYLLANKRSPEFTIAAPLMNIRNMCLVQAHTHTHTCIHTLLRGTKHNKCLCLSKSICVRGVGSVRYQNEVG